jgi:hypothetical protein
MSFMAFMVKLSVLCNCIVMHVFLVKCNGNLIYYISFYRMYSVNSVNFTEWNCDAFLSMPIVN